MDFSWIMIFAIGVLLLVMAVGFRLKGYDRTYVWAGHAAGTPKTEWQYYFKPRYSGWGSVAGGFTLVSILFVNTNVDSLYAALS